MMIVYIILTIVPLLILAARLHQRHERSRLVRVIEKNCTRCRSCIKRCRHKALDVENKDNGPRIVVKNPEKCSGCGNCIKVCRFNALEFIERNSA